MSEDIPQAEIVERPPMPAGFRLRTFPDKLLRQVSEPIKLSSSAGSTFIPIGDQTMALDTFINRLTQAMYSLEECGGLAAVQIGVPIRLLIYNPDHQMDADSTVVMINPEIVEQSEETNEAEELCMSLQDQWCLIKRPSFITVKYFDEKLMECELKIDEDWHSRIVLHEFDHLEGKLNIDRLSPFSKQLFITKYHKDQKIKRRRKKK